MKSRLMNYLLVAAISSTATSCGYFEPTQANYSVEANDDIEDSYYRIKTDVPINIERHYSDFDTTKGPDTGFSILVDKETGVCYLEFDYGYSYGITPLLNADGTPKLWEEGLDEGETDE